MEPRASLDAAEMPSIEARELAAECYATPGVSITNTGIFRLRLSPHAPQKNQYNLDHYDAWIHLEHRCDHLTPLLSLTPALKTRLRFTLYILRTYDIRVVFLLRNLLYRCLPQTRRLDEEITICLQEALTNAFIHGTLGLNQGFHDLSTYDNYHQHIKDAILSGSWLQPITVTMDWNETHLEIIITDGQENEPSPGKQNPLSLQTPHGRGLAIIKSMSCPTSSLENLHHLILRFPLPEPSPQNDNHPLYSSLILLADDAEINLIAMEQLLRQKGFQNFVHASNGQEALEKTLAQKPDIVLLDLRMPVMDGYQYCQEIRKHPQHQNLPVLVQTVLNMPSQRSKAFEMGATDLVSKPLNVDEVTARICLHLERMQLLNDLRNYKESIDQELVEARTMQETLLPQESRIKKLEQTHQLVIASHYEPSFKLGGDIWGTAQIDAERIVLYQADFSGHGISAALNTFRLHTLIQDLIPQAPHPGEFMSKLNQRLHILLPKGQFATFFYAMLDRQNHLLSYSAASHPHPLFFQDANSKTTMLNGTGIPLGVLSNTQYPTHAIPMHPNDCIILFSDALLESGPVPVEEKDLMDFMQPEQHTTAAEKLKRTLDFFYRNHGTSPPSDDLTITIYQRH